MNKASWIILAMIAAAAVWAIVSIIRNKKKGKYLCGGDCAHCLYNCTQEEKDKRLAHRNLAQPSAAEQKDPPEK